MPPSITRRAFAHSIAAAAAAQPPARLKRRPNVLLALSAGWSPAAAAVAAEGARFTRFYLSAGDSANRAALLTGRYALRSSVWGDSGGRDTLPTAETTIAEALHIAGYRTALFGDWRLGRHYPYLPHTQGFDEFVGFGAATLATEALRFLDERHNPFFLYLAGDIPLAPVLARIDFLGLAENTIVILLAARPPRAPFAIRWTGHIPLGIEVATPAAPIDLYPTLLELCRAPQPDDAFPIDGISLVPLLAPDPPRWPDRPLFFYPGVVRTARFTLLDDNRLYDAAADPAESTDVAAQFPGEAARLRRIYDAWYRGVLPPGGLKVLPIPIGHPEEDPVCLSPAEAQASAPALAWTIDAVRAARYDVTVRYSSPDAGRIEIRAAGRGLAAAIWPVAGPTSRAFGALNLPRGASLLEVSADPPERTRIVEVCLKRSAGKP